MNIKYQYLIRKFFGLALFLMVFPADLNAGSLRKYGKTKKQKAPTYEDHAKYFSSQEAGTSWKKRAMADKLRIKTINSIRKLLDSRMKKARKFELYLRLGEIHAERSNYLRSVEIRSWEKKQDIWRKYKKGREPVLDHSASKNELLKSASTFRKLVQSFPKHPRVDAALFSLAKTLGRLSNDNAEMYFKQLIRKYPKSSLIPDAHLALGEYYFDSHQVERAIKSYKKASKFKNSRIYPYAIYKLGWAYFNSDPKSDKKLRANYRKALAAFKLVVRLSDRDTTGRGLNLRKEAISDLVLVWAETEGVNDAWAYFSKLDEYEAFYDVLEKLGRTYVDQGKNRKAILALTRLLREAPTRERNPELYKMLAGLYDQSGKLNSVVVCLKAMHKMYSDESSVWRAEHNKDKDLVADAEKLVERAIHRYGALYHSRGQKQKNDAFLKSSMDLYRIYLSYYPKSKNAYEINFYLADIYFHFKMYEPASDQYTKVALAGSNGKHFKESALNAVASMNKVIEEKVWPKLPSLGKIDKPLPIPREKRKMVKVIDTYVRLLPKSKDGIPMRFTAAKIFFDHGHYDVSLLRFRSIASQLPRTKQGKLALKTTLAFHSSKKQWKTVMEKSQYFMKVKALMKVKSSRKLVENHFKNALYRQALKLADEKKRLEAARMFLAYQKKFPKDADADKALFNASVNFYKEGRLDKALATDKSLLALYPRSKLIPKVSLNMGRTYEGLADFENSAKAYSMFALRYPRDGKAPASLYNAATLYRGLKNYNTSIDLYSKFVRRYPKHGAVGEALYEMGGIFEKTRSYANAVESYNRFLMVASNADVNRLYFVKAKLAQIQYLHVNRATGRQKLLSLARNLQKRNNIAAFEARRIVSSVLFNELAQGFVRFKNMKIRSAQTLEADVQRKQGILLSQAQQYEGVIGIGSGEYIVASLYRLGEMHENFANDLLTAPAPQGANQVTIDEYKSSIEKVAFPLKEEAFKYYETAYKRAAEVETFTIWTKRAYAKIAELYPAKHPEIMEKSSSPAYLSHNMIWGPNISGLVK